MIVLPIGVETVRCVLRQKLLWYERLSVFLKLMRSEDFVNWISVGPDGTLTIWDEVEL